MAVGVQTSERNTQGPDRGVSRSTRKRGILETLFLEPGARRSQPQAGRRTRLVDLCAPWLSLAAALRRMPQLPDPEALRARALELKSSLEHAARDAGHTAGDTEAAVFALIALTDETIMNTQGPARTAWMVRPLQLEVFGQNVAGEEFYTRLERYRKEREERIEALEVYYCCLAFGFAGKLRLAGPDRLQALLTEVERDIAAVRGTSRRPLAPHAARHEELADVVAEGVPVWLSLAVFVPATLLTFLIIKLLAHYGASSAARAIRELVPS